MGTTMTMYHDDTRDRLAYSVCHAVVTVWNLEDLDAEERAF
jgi:hypothetical protein